MDTRPRIIKLISGAMCNSCRFLKLATVELPNGSTQRMISCQRLDCDNWIITPNDVVPISILEED